MNPPDITIVIASYNAQDFLRQNLAAVVRQTFTDWECVLVDDGSTDASAEICQEFARADRRFRVLVQANQGVVAARNNGLAITSPGSKYVCFHDADDVWTDDALQTLVDALQQNPGAAGAHGLADLIDENDRAMGDGGFTHFGRSRLRFDGHQIVEQGPTGPTTFSMVLYSNKIYPPGLLLMRRQVLEKIGLWEPGLDGVEDWDMVIRLTRHGDLAFADKVIVHYRRHAGNQSNSMPRDVASRMYYRTYNSPENTTEQLETLSKGWRAWQKYKMREKFDAAGRHWLKGEFRDCAQMLGHTAGHGCRFIAGRPKR